MSREEELRKRIKFHEEPPSDPSLQASPFIASDFQTTRKLVEDQKSVHKKQDDDMSENKNSSRFKMFILLFIAWTVILILFQFFFTYRHKGLFLATRFARRYFAGAKTSGYGSAAPSEFPRLDMTLWKDKLPFRQSGGDHETDLFQFTRDDLKHYRGVEADLPVLIALKKRVYDVTRGRGFYGPGGGYHFFSGRDGSRSFVTGCFEESFKCTEKSHVIDDLTVEEQQEVDNWVNFYDDKYDFVGMLVD